jgi:type II secretory pathway pseudopilin PulG
MQRYLTKQSEQGLTLVECLAAIMVLTAIITAISPALLIAYGSRIHSRKVAQAQKLAQGEINRVKLEVESGNYKDTQTYTEKLPPEMAAAGGGRFDMASAQAPQQGNNRGECSTTNPTTGRVREYCTVDTNGDGEWDMAVQTFRTDVADVPDGVAFLMGVRVYTKTAIDSGNLLPNPRFRTASAGLTAGQSLSLPLVYRQEAIVRGDLPQGLSRKAQCLLAVYSSNTGVNSDCALE